MDDFDTASWHRVLFAIQDLKKSVEFDPTEERLLHYAEAMLNEVYGHALKRHMSEHHYTMERQACQ
jgi:hypothetical protein